MQIFYEKVEIFCHKTYFSSVLHSFCTKLTEAATPPTTSNCGTAAYHT